MNSPAHGRGVFDCSRRAAECKILRLDSAHRRWDIRSSQCNAAGRAHGLSRDEEDYFMRREQRSILLIALLAISAAAMLMTSAPTASGNSGSDFENAPLPTAYFHPRILYFKVGRVSSATTTLTNTSAETLIISSLAITGGRDISISGNTCGASLAGGASCEVTLSCLPTSAGPLGKLVEGDNSAVGHHDVLLGAR